VLIEIEEPHMYNDDDAIAKIDGYVISISGGGAYVGERKLIRINEVKRTAAYASLVTDNGGGPEAIEVGVAADEMEPPVAHASEAAVEHASEAAVERAPEAEAEAEDAGRVQANGSPARRRRGRRGGRRRSRAKGA
jgi:ribonuclease G